ncbi:MAG: heavy metal translocating P-type ATPase metal-binding domain-containing protein [Rhodothermales bacterium]
MGRGSGRTHRGNPIRRYRSPGLAVAVSRTTVVACHHCGLPVPPGLQDTSPAFCCSSCRTVHAILSETGLDATYYRLRESAPDTPASRRSPGTAPNPSRQAALLDELDAPDFMGSHAARLDGGQFRTHLYLDGVHCAACVWLVEQLPVHVDGVAHAELNLPRGRLSLEWDPERVRLSDVARWLSRFGYPVLPRVDGEQAPESAEERRLLIRMGVSWALAGNIMLIAFALYSGLSTDAGSLLTSARWLSLLLAIPAVFYGGSVFLKRAWFSVRLAVSARSPRHLHMDTPISVGILAGFMASAWATVSGSGEIWFDSIAVLIAALLSARWLQLRARRLAGNSSEELLALLPTMAWRVDPDGSTRHVRADGLAVDDRVRVRPGELIPVDGFVERGESLLGNAVLTGESRPVRVGPGSAVFAGTTNETETLIIQVRATGAATRIGSLLAWVAEDRRTERDALASSHTQRPANPGRPSRMEWVDRIGGWFTITVLALAAVTGVLWSVLQPASAISHVIALLVITCPCALGMATPLATAIGLGRAARRGLFIKDESTLSRAGTIDTVLLDKTGTVTAGRMTIEEVVGAADAVRLAAPLEAHVMHPIAGAFAAATDGLDLPEATGVRQAPSQGVSGTVEGRSLRVGRPDWVAPPDAWPDDLRQAADRMATSGRSPVGISVDGCPVAVVAIADPILPDAASLIARLSPHYRMILCSGDDPQTTRDVGRRLGLPDAACLGGYLPEEKRNLVRDLQSRGHGVLVVGDGVNDAGALQAADIGLAVAGGSAASQMAADVFTTRPGLAAVSELLVESRGVTAIIRRNLGMSLAYNVLGAGLAMGGLVTPLVAAVAMPLSSFAVVLSSIFQRTFRTEHPS